MKTAKIAKLVCVAGLTVACVWGLTACANIKNASSSGGVAATVNGTEISEDKITAQVESVRSSMSLTDEDAWGNWLAENSYTPSSVREQIIDSYVQQELIRQGAAEKNITVESSTIDDYVQQMKD